MIYVGLDNYRAETRADLENVLAEAGTLIEDVLYGFGLRKDLLGLPQGDVPP